MDTLDFRAIKARVSILQVLASRGIPMRRDGHRLVGRCPVHHGDNPRAFVVDLDRNLWYCFTGCASGGDVLDLVRRLDGVGWREAALHLEALGGRPATPVPSPAPTRPAEFRPWVRRLDLDPDTPFLRDKGIRRDTALRFEAGAWNRPGFLAGCVGVRLHDLSGKPLGYAGRRLDPDEVARYGKWKLPPGLPRREILLGAHRAPPDGPVVVTECPWGVMRLAQLAVPAVALLGTALSEFQHRWLLRRRRVALIMDGDAAGRAASQRIAALLPRAVPVDLPDGCDPDDLSDDDLAYRLPPLFLL